MSEEETPKKPLWKRWWFVIGAVVFVAGAIVAGVFLSRRLSAREHLQSVIDGMVADGRGAWPEDLYDMLEPRMSEERAAEFDALAAGEDVAALVDFVNEHGVPHSSYLRWMKQQPRTMRLPDLGVVQPPDDPSYSTLAQWIAGAAAAAENPEPSLAALDRLLTECVELPQGDLGALTRVNVMDRRDRAHLDLALAGRLPAERAARWLAEDLDLPLDVLARGLRSQRLLIGGLFARQALGKSGGNFMTELVYSRMWSAEDAALYIELLAESEETALRRGVPRTDEEYKARIADVSGSAGFGGALLNNTGRLVRVGYLARTRARLTRLAARVLLLKDREGRLPSDEAELREWMGADALLLDASESEPAVLYRHWPGNLRLVADPKTRPPTHGPHQPQPPDDTPGPIRISMDEVLIRM